MLSSRLPWLVFLGLFQSILCGSTNEEVLKFCIKHNVTIRELEDEANNTGISVAKLVSMMNAEYPSAYNESSSGKSSADQIIENTTSTDNQAGYEDVLGFFPSSSIILSSDMAKNETAEEPEVGLKAKLSTSLDTETLKLDENTLFVNNEESRVAAGDMHSKISEPVSHIEPDTQKKHRLHKIELIKRRPRHSTAIYKLVESRPRTGREVGKRYFIINRNGEKEEYKVVKHHPRLIRAHRVNIANQPRKLRIIERRIQPLIIARPDSVPLQGPPMHIPYMPGHHGVVAPPQAPQFHPQAIPQVPPFNPQAPHQGPPIKTMNDMDDMNTNENYRSNDKNSFIGPMTISIIVVILIIICIIGGFCFCGATGTNRSPKNMQLLPRPQNIPPQNIPPQTPYNSRTPIVPQSQNLPMQQQQLAPPQGRQVFGYAIIPNIR